MHGLLKNCALVPLLIGLCFAAAAQADSLAQQKKGAATSFQLHFNVGLLAGASGRDIQAQVVPGLRYKTWGAGIGAGLDYYYLRSIPLFIEVRKHFQKPMPLFLYAAAGGNLPGPKKEEKRNDWYRSDFKTGLYNEAGVGWQFKLNKGYALMLQAGYSRKQLSEIQWFNYQLPGTGDEQNKSKIKYDLRRLSFKVGFQL